MLGDDGFRLSTLLLRPEEAGPPEVVKQDTVGHKPGNTWTGLTAVTGSVVLNLGPSRALS